MQDITTYLGYISLVVAALIPIANPFSTAPMFLSLTGEFSKQERQKTVNLAALYMFIFLSCFLFFGAHLLAFFGIELTSLRIAGGLIIAYLGFRMLFPAPIATASSSTNATSANDIAFMPLAMPSMSGPGAISVVIAMAAQINEAGSLQSEVIGFAVVTAGIAASACICWLVLSGASKVVKFLGNSGIQAMTKVMGFFLISIGVDMVVSTVTLLFQQAQ